MKIHPGRVGGLFDVLLAIGAVVLGLLLARTEPEEIERSLGLLRTADSDPGIFTAGRAPDRLAERVWQRLMPAFEGLPPVLCVATPGLALATFRHREARTRRVLRGPGVLATALAAILDLVYVSTELALRRFSVLQRGYLHNPFDTIWRDIGVHVGLAVAGTWVVLALGSAWRPRSDGYDRAGRLLGAAWVTYMLWERIGTRLIGPV